ADPFAEPLQGGHIADGQAHPPDVVRVAGQAIVEVDAVPDLIYEARIAGRLELLQVAVEALELLEDRGRSVLDVLQPALELGQVDGAVDGRGCHVGYLRRRRNRVAITPATGAVTAQSTSAGTPSGEPLSSPEACSAGARPMNS